MKIFNVGIVGYGKMGKIFAKEIKKKVNSGLLMFLLKQKLKMGLNQLKISLIQRISIYL